MGNPFDRIGEARFAVSPLRLERSNAGLLSVVGGFLFIAVAFAAIAQADSSRQPAARISCNIPAQSLASALQLFGQASGVQVLYETRVAEGQQSAAVDGELSASDCLLRLLVGTDIRVSYLRPDVITLATPSSLGDLPPPSSVNGADLSLTPMRVRASADGENQAGRREYSEAVQSDIELALGKNAKTRSGNYRFGIDVWVDAARTIQRTEIYQSSGDRERDTAIAMTLRGVTLRKAAPVNTPQPVRVVVVVRSMQ